MKIIEVMSRSEQPVGASRKTVETLIFDSQRTILYEGDNKLDLNLKESVVLVTGSSSGIGKAAAIAFGVEGAQVGVTYRANRQGAEDTAQKVRNAGGQALVLHYDLADPDSIRSIIDELDKEWGALHVLVNNAAPMEASGPTGQLFEEVPLKNWEGMLRRTLEGVTLTMQSALPLLRKSGWGRIVTVSSDAVDGWPGLGPYATAKAGLHGLSRTLAVELGPANILSNVVMPGAVMTERTEHNLTPEQKEQIKQTMPTRRLITPEDVAAFIVFLGSPVNRQITGEIIRITGGR
ncbi:MAG: SDR family oxidoreductase [Anaerolineales bacterium]|nr:SDR family oxidoreductase [Anaerolineales bacterium]